MVLVQHGLRMEMKSVQLIYRLTAPRAVQFSSVARDDGHDHRQQQQHAAFVGRLFAPDSASHCVGGPGLLVAECLHFCSLLVSLPARYVSCCSGPPTNERFACRSEPTQTQTRLPVDFASGPTFRFGVVVAI